MEKTTDKGQPVHSTKDGLNLTRITARDLNAARSRRNKSRRRNGRKGGKPATAFIELSRATASGMTIYRQLCELINNAYEWSCKHGSFGVIIDEDEWSEKRNGILDLLLYHILDSMEWNMESNEGQKI